MRPVSTRVQKTVKNYLLKRLKVMYEIHKRDLTIVQFTIQNTTFLKHVHTNSRRFRIL